MESNFIDHIRVFCASGTADCIHLFRDGIGTELPQEGALDGPERLMDIYPCFYKLNTLKF